MSLRSKTIGGLVWTGASKVSMHMVLFLGNILLARIPDKADFGIAWFADGTLNRSSSRSYRPADSANRNAGTRPAADTRFGSSHTGRIV